jgi:hypothetical protein
MIDISEFSGEQPKVSSRLLPPNAATVALNCDLESGRLATIKGVSTVRSVFAGATTIHRLTAGDFLQWPSHVNVVKALVADSGNRVLFTGDGYPKETNASLALGSSPFPASTRRLGIPAPNSALNIGISGDPAEDAEVIRACSYVYTIVGKWEDGSEVESSPSPPTAVTDQLDGQVFTLSNFVDASATGVFTTHFRIYRLNAGDYGAEYQFMADIPVSASSYVDGIADVDLGEVLPSSSWTAPVDDLSGLIATSHGLVFGFSGNTIYPSEVFIPYAFPEEYSLVAESDIVGLGYTGSMVVALTETVPYILVGQDPSTMALQRLGYQQPCISARSIVGLPGGVAYACPDGLFLISESGAGSLITKKIFTKAQWKAMTPEDIFGFYYNDAYFAFFNGSTKGFKLDLMTGRYENFTLLQPVHGGEYCAEDDLLYLIQTDGTAREVVSWGTGPAREYTWTSKDFSFPNASAYTAGMVQGDYSAGTTKFRFYVDGDLVSSRVLSTGDLFRLPPRLGSTFKVQVTGRASIDRILVATSVSDILGRL